MQKGCNCRRNSRGSFPTGLKGEELHQGKEERETLSCARLSMKQARILSNQISEARAHQPIPAAHYLLLVETWSTTLMKQISIDAFDSAPCLLSCQCYYWWSHWDDFNCHSAVHIHCNLCIHNIDNNINQLLIVIILNIILILLTLT